MIKALEKASPEPRVEQHRSLERVSLVIYGPGDETWHADHGVVDEKGRKVGGRVKVNTITGSSQLTVRIIATRDGIEFGAIRRSESCTNLEHAHEVATRKLAAQRKAFARKYPAVAS